MKLYTSLKINNALIKVGKDRKVTGRFAYKSFRLQVDSPTSRSFRLHDQSRFAYTVWVDSPTLKSIRLH